MRLHRGMRWLPRHLPPDHRERADCVRKSLPIRMARHFGGGSAGFGRTRLCEPRARLRAAEYALTPPHAPVPAMRARRANRKLARCAYLGGATSALRDARRVDAE